MTLGSAQAPRPGGDLLPLPELVPELPRRFALGWHCFLFLGVSFPGTAGCFLEKGTRSWAL